MAYVKGAGYNHLTDPTTMARQKVEFAHSELERAERELYALLNPADYTQTNPEQRARQGQ